MTLYEKILITIMILWVIRFVYEVYKWIQK